MRIDAALAFSPAEGAQLTELLYVRGITRTGACEADALHALQEHYVGTVRGWLLEYNAALAAPSCPSLAETKNLGDLVVARRILQKQDGVEEASARVLVGLLGDARKRLAEQLRALPEDSRSAPALRQMIGATGEALSRLRGELTGALASAVTDAMALGVELAETVLGAAEAAVPFGFSDELLRNISAYHADLVTGLTDSVRAAVTREVQLGILAGTDSRTLVKKIVATGVDAVGPFPTAEHRADVIARTEINRTSNLATYERYTDASTRIDQLTKSWLSANDLRVRFSHRALNGVTLPMDGLFDVGGTKAPFPMWPGLPASESISCRCRLISRQPGSSPVE